MVRDAVRLDDAMEPYLHGDEAMRAANGAIETAIADAGSRWAGVPMVTMLSGRDSKATDISSVPVNARSDAPTSTVIIARSTRLRSLTSPKCRESHARSFCANYAVGIMFWFTRKRLVGSYLFLMSTNLSKFSR